MEKKVKMLTKNQLDSVNRLRTDLTAYLKLGVPSRDWDGFQDITNPSVIDPKTGKALVIGTRETHNVNFEIHDEKLAKRIAIVLEKDKNNNSMLSDTGEYIQYDFGGLTLNATNCYIGKISGNFEIQFALPTASKKFNSSDPDAVAKVVAKFSKPVKEERFDVKTGEVKTNAQVPAGNVEDDMPF